MGLGRHVFNSLNVRSSALRQIAEQSISMLSTHTVNAGSGRMVSTLAQVCHGQPFRTVLRTKVSTARSLAAIRSLLSAGADQQQPATQAAAEYSVRDTMKLLEAGIGPLGQLPMVPPPRPRVIVISGPSGVGKDAVLKRLQELRPDLYFVVTATSRAMRPGEVEGKDYVFVSKQQFESWIHSGQLLEHALVYGEYKGIPRQHVDAALQNGRDVVLRIDVQGAATVRQLLPGVVCVFLAAESEAQLVARLVSRKTEPVEKMLTRVKTARDETKQISEFDYVVVNRDGQLDECVAQICSIISAEKLRTWR